MDLITFLETEHCKYRLTMSADIVDGKVYEMNFKVKSAAKKDKIKAKDDESN